MSSFCWAADIHLEHATESALGRFIDQVKLSGSNSLVLAGDIAVSSSICARLKNLHNQLELPIYFVLGNHDFYGSSLEKVREKIRDLLPSYPRLHYLTDERVVPLENDLVLIGHDSWADGLAGDYEHSQVLLNDYVYIENFSNLTHAERGQLLGDLGKTATDNVRQKLQMALSKSSKVLLVMHVPPFPEGALFQNKPSGKDWIPHFVCYQMGKMLLEIMQEHPQQHLTVLAGHTHHFAHYHPLPNIECFTASANYGNPELQLPIFPNV